jgi:hypothetical protein
MSEHIEERGHVCPEGSHYYGKYGRSYCYLGDFGGHYVSDASTRWDDGLVGPYPTRRAAIEAAEARNREEGLG